MSILLLLLLLKCYVKPTACIHDLLDVTRRRNRIKSYSVHHVLSKGRLAAETSLKQHQRRTHGLPNVYHIVDHTCTQRLLNSILLSPHCRLRPCRTKSLYLSCYSSLQLALPELPERKANGLTDLAIFILRYIPCATGLTTINLYRNMKSLCLFTMKI